MKTIIIDGIEYNLTHKARFKKGDWVVYHRNNSSTEIMNVYDIRDNRYYFNDNIHFSWSVKECDEKCRIWTIEDAKVGDVLVTKVKEQPFIFKGLLDEFHPKHPVAYCGIDFMNEFMIPAGVSWWTDVEVKPATKEQCNFLFQKMHDAGYEWNAVKKELKKIEQKPIDEEMKEALRTEYEKGRADAIAEMQNHAWSEEGENNILFLTSIIEECFKDKENITLYGDTVCANFTKENVINRLKSLRPQNIWKPTEEQLKQLGKYCPDNTALTALYEQLKKLRKE